MTAYHATRALSAVLADGKVKPARMAHVYAFTDRSAADAYAAEFGYPDVVAVDVPAASVVARWAPSYCSAGKVLKIRGAVTVIHAPTEL